MMKFTESFTAGHPDKLCDQIADAVLDEFLRRDKDTRAHIDVFGGHGAVMVSGHVDTQADFDVAAIVKRVYKEAGYKDDLEPFVHLGKGVHENDSINKGGSVDQAVCYGYATKATREMLPHAVVYANAIAKKLDEAREHDTSMSWLRPDGRVLLGMDGRTVKHVVLEVQHSKDARVKDVQQGILEKIIQPVIGTEDGVKILINPAGPFLQGGLGSRTGVSGRRATADLYGGLIPQSGVSLSGKDPRHPQRAGTYMARFVARHVVKEGLASQALVKLVYIAGRVDPVVFEVTGDKGEDLSEALKSTFDFKIDAIVEQFSLKKPLFRALSAYGHIGRSDVPWEK